MKNLLYLEYFFPPLITNWRTTAFTKYLPEFGWKPIVIAADENVSYEKDYSLLSEIPQDLKVIRVGHREPPRTWRALKRRLKIEAEFPDYYGKWYHPAYLAARRILEKQKIDLIFSASPTFTTALVAMKLKKEFHIPWVAHLLDGWAVNDFLKVENENIVAPLRWFYEMRVRRAEKQVLQSADKTVAVSWHVKQRLVELHGVREGRIEVVTNGYDESIFQGLGAAHLFPDRPTVTFLGSFYTHFREPIMRFLDVVSQIDNHAQVLFIGRAAVPVHNMHMHNATCILHLPRAEALSFALGSDFLLVVMPSFAKWIPAKMYDYLRIGKPILALVPEDGDAARIVKEAKAGFILSYDSRMMKLQLEKIFEQSKRGDFKDVHPDWEYVKQFEWRKRTERIAKVFDEVAG